MGNFRSLFIDDVGRWWKFYSTHAYLVTLAIGGALAWFAKEYPQQFQQLPSWVLFVLAAFMAFGFMVSRIVKQDAGAPTPPDGGTGQ